MRPRRLASDPRRVVTRGHKQDGGGVDADTVDGEQPSSAGLDQVGGQLSSSVLSASMASTRRPNAFFHGFSAACLVAAGVSAAAAIATMVLLLVHPATGLTLALESE